MIIYYLKKIKILDLNNFGIANIAEIIIMLLEQFAIDAKLKKICFKFVKNYIVYLQIYIYF